MTREEALKILKYRSGWNLSIRDVNALDMAIKALEEKSCEDTINREQAIDAVANLFEMSEYPHPYPQGKPIRLRDIKEKLKQLPPVQPKIKTGHWIHRSTDEYGGITTWYECSECGRSVEDIYHVYGEYPYCHCGAKMIESQESEGKE